MKTAKEIVGALTESEVRTFLTCVIEALYCREEDGELDPDKEWSPNTLDDLGRILGPLVSEGWRGNEADLSGDPNGPHFVGCEGERDQQGTIITNDMNKAKDLILGHIEASGPVSQHSIEYYLEQQFNGRIETYQLADMLNDLIRSHRIELYDDAESFVASS